VELTSWILGFADAAEVLSPKWLRKEVAKKVNILASRYSESHVPPALPELHDFKVERL
jgi:hypothetical protein